MNFPVFRVVGGIVPDFTAGTWGAIPICPSGDDSTLNNL